MKLNIAYQTHVGMKRKLNEDSLSYLRLNLSKEGSFDIRVREGSMPEEKGILQEGAFEPKAYPSFWKLVKRHGLDSDEIHILVVADGMGGHRAGEVASSYVARNFPFKALKELLLNYDRSLEDKGMLEAFSQTVKEINQEIRNLADSDEDHYGNMGTTLTAVLLLGDEGYVINVGDSRTYLLRTDVLEQRSRDHSFVQALVEAGAITQEEARDHPQRNIITRTIGTKAEVEPEVFPFSLKKHDTVLLCSDGLSDLVTDEEIVEILQGGGLEQAAQALVDRANSCGGKDNITVLLGSKT